MRAAPALRPASEPEPARSRHVAAGAATAIGLHLLCQWGFWDASGPSMVYGLIGLTQLGYLGPLAALVWRWPRGWRVGVVGVAILTVLVNASMLHLIAIRS